MVRLIKRAESEPFYIDSLIIKVFELYHEMRDFPFESIIEKLFDEEKYTLLSTKSAKLEQSLKFFSETWNDLTLNPMFRKRVGQNFQFKTEDIKALFDLEDLARDIGDPENYEHKINLADFQVRWIMILKGLEGICDTFNDKLGDQIQEISNKNFKTSN